MVNSDSEEDRTQRRRRGRGRGRRPRSRSRSREPSNRRDNSEESLSEEENPLEKISINLRGIFL